jgi:hypothetical protein
MSMGTRRVAPLTDEVRPSYTREHNNLRGRSNIGYAVKTKRHEPPRMKLSEKKAPTYNPVGL